MKTYELYRTLSPDVQSILLWHQGRYLTSVRMMGMRFLLYSLGDFFVEVCYHPEQGRITGMRSFRDTGSFHPYLKAFATRCGQA